MDLHATEGLEGVAEARCRGAVLRHHREPRTGWKGRGWRIHGTVNMSTSGTSIATDDTQVGKWGQLRPPRDVIRESEDSHRRVRVSRNIRRALARLEIQRRGEGLGGHERPRAHRQGHPFAASSGSEESDQRRERSLDRRPWSGSASRHDKPWRVDDVTARTARNESGSEHLPRSTGAIPNHRSPAGVTRRINDLRFGDKDGRCRSRDGNDLRKSREPRFPEKGGGRSGHIALS